MMVASIASWDDAFTCIRVTILVHCREALHKKQHAVGISYDRIQRCGVIESFALRVSFEVCGNENRCNADMVIL